MGIYARVQFLPSYYMQTFEEMFTTGFFEKGLAIFGPNAKNPTLRYVAYKEVEVGDPVQRAVLQAEEHRQQEDIHRAFAHAISKLLRTDTYQF